MIQVLDGDRPLVRFVQRAVGYSLTGETDEQVLFLLHGTGANGKSTFLNIIAKLLGGDYACTTPAEMLLDKKFEGASNDVARLRKARFVTALEVEGRPLNEAKIKRLTGQDKVTARFMYGEFFEFVPEFKLWLAANRKPIIDGSGEAMWRRIRLIPFTVEIPEDQRDQGLALKLGTELPGILAWFVRGAVAWYERGLGMPDSVRLATDGYRHEMDIVAQFLRQYCDTGPGKSVSATSVVQS